MRTLTTVCAFVIMMASNYVFASTSRNDVPSCMRNIEQELINQDVPRELIVIVDETMSSSLNGKVMREAFEQIRRFIQPGDEVQIVQFSSLQKDGYTHISFKGKTDIPLSEAKREYVRKSQLEKLNRCLKKQEVYFINLIGKELKESFKPIEANTNSEIIGSIRDIGNDIVKKSNTKRKVVLIISDMLENSETTSFYSNRRVRQIDSASELEKIKHKKQLSDFGGADIYIIGAGLLPGGESYVSSQKMEQIEKFWQGYFSKSNGQLLGFGKPMLLSQFQ